MNAATAAPLDLIIAQCDDQGQPDHINQTVRRVVLQATDVSAGFANPILVGDIWVLGGWFGGPGTGFVYRYPFLLPVYIYPLRINFPPVFLQAGKRYSISYVSTGDHRFCISDRWECMAVHQGCYWVNGSGGLYLWPSLTSPKSLRFMLHYCTWGQWQNNSNASGGGVRMELQLQPLQMAGGIAGIDVLADTIIPAATDLSYQIQLAGQWQPFSEDPNTPQLASLPPLLPFKIVFTGTTDLMPGINFSQSQVQLTGGEASTFHHISEPIAIAAACTHVKVVCKLISFDTTHHSCVASIHFGTTHANPDVVGDAVQTDGSIDRTWTFNQSIAALGSFYVEIDGSTDNAIPGRFIVASRVAYAD
jgi:hypothetical protein